MGYIIMTRQFFISHMVQMKVLTETGRLFEKELLYIPHGSDERVRIADLESLFLDLYIPHGSDESTQVFYGRYISQCFISHMVQMKVAKKVALNPN